MHSLKKEFCEDPTYMYPPTHSENSDEASYISIHYLSLKDSPPSPPRKFQSLLWEECGYFLELHNASVTGSLSGLPVSEIIETLELALSAHWPNRFTAVNDQLML